MKEILISSFCVLLIAFSKVLGETQNGCKELKCGDQGPPVRFPFILKDRHPDHCGYPGFVVSCNEKQETVLELPIPAKFSVKIIDYKYQEVHLYDSDNCLLLKVSEILNFSISPFHFSEEFQDNLALFKCSLGLERRQHVHVLNGPCLTSPGHHVYVVDPDYKIDNLQSCTKIRNVLSVPSSGVLKWSKPHCTECEAGGKRCIMKNNGNKSEIECVNLTKSATLGSFAFFLLVVAVYQVHYYDTKEKENEIKIRRFLQDYKAHKPSRYSYADIKRITNQFHDKLGQGAYGTVFKGKLSSECFVAVKVINSSNGNGEDFVNEVGTMGRIHHVNVVRLVGFCADGFNRALVYEFFANGSLHDFISSADNNNRFLGWDKLQDIALAVAKGVQYLHQGCDQRILHFDIKPHNVLLDDNFTPKISDFGMAKLCSKDQSIVSMTTARGTMGYIAPEVFSRNFGNVSYKSDVYSFGMLLLEMVGGRKNIDSTSENTNEIYYPEWIYNLLEEGDDLRIHLGEEGDGKAPKKLAIVGLWCIQWHPAGRPSMNKVVQMLEGGENLTMPPNPFASTGPA
ncbi:receptor-like protein kinase [Pyrus ussuriensis x Pyrus communis]|uniref:Receptor-like protein kinase n=1 Tax=Pyrus ussuriensis x Pyrus communis TaxID=2448454 RepID=A0A5N5F8P1_9ROSA|nr:receptor-like protein kinase [Pyrus ussuriensis x Pyrus communis]